MTISFHKSSNKITPKSILIIDKEDSFRKGLVISLMDHFSEIRVTDNPFEGIDLAKNTSPDIILTGMIFKTLSAPELIKELKSAGLDNRTILLSSEEQRNSPTLEESLKNIKTIHRYESIDTIIQTIKKFNN